jgi:CHASE3 domain sensor protein
MIRTPDTTIGQRLAVGFALLIVPLAILLGVAISAQLSVADKQRTFEREILPRARVAEDLERSIFDTALLIRKHLLSPSDETRMDYIRGADRVIMLRGELAALTQQGEGRQLLVRFDRKLDGYLARADEITGQDAGAPLDLELERILQAQRERLLAPLRAISDLEKRETSAVLEGITHYSERVFRGLLVAGGAGLLLIVVVSLLTARSIRRPILSLVEIARALERGDWEPARRHASGRRVLAAMDASPSPRDEAEVLRRAFGHAAAALERRERRLRADREVAAAAATEVDVASLAAAALGAVVPHLAV